MPFEMKTEQIDPIHSPKHFFLPDEEAGIPVLDDKGVEIGMDYPFTLVNKDVSKDYVSGSCLCRRCKDMGEQCKHILAVMIDRGDLNGFERNVE